MATNIKTDSLGKILIQSGIGKPIHNAPKGSYFYEISSGKTYIYNNDWDITTPLDKISEISDGPTGFVNRTDSVLSFNDSNRTFTISPNQDNFIFYNNGKQYKKENSENYIIPDTEGTHYIFYTNDGSLSSTTNFTLDHIFTKTLVSFVYWDKDNQKHIMLMDERHGLNMDQSTHALLHSTIHAKYNDGLLLSGFTIGDGSLNSHVEFSITDGSFWDEDIFLEINNNNPQKLDKLETKVLYQSGNTGIWRSNNIISTTPYLTSSNGLLLYNKRDHDTNTYSLAEITNGYYMLYHIFATNDINTPIILFMGDYEYESISSARLGAKYELSLLDIDILPTPEFIKIGTIILKSDLSYNNNVKSKIVKDITDENWINWIDDDLLPSNTIIVKEVHDFPYPSNNIIHLQESTDYLLTTNIDIGDNSIQIANNSRIWSNNRFISSLTSSSNNALFIGTGCTFSLHNISIKNVKKCFDLIDVSQQQLLTTSDIYYVNIENLGKIDGYMMISFDHCGINNFKYGFEFKENLNFVINSQYFMPSAITYNYTSDVSQTVNTNETVLYIDEHGLGKKHHLYKNISNAITIDDNTDYTLISQWSDITSYNIKISTNIPIQNTGDVYNIINNRFKNLNGNISLMIDGENVDVNYCSIALNSFSGTHDGDIEGIDAGNNKNFEISGNIGIRNYMILPNATTDEINQINNPLAGFMMLNTDESKIAYYDGNKWNLIDSIPMGINIFYEDFEGSSGIVWHYRQSNSVNKWYIGTAAGSGYNSSSGNSHCAYISNNSSDWTYTNNDTANSHMYTDVSIPSGITTLTLIFEWKGYAENGYDWLKVYDAPTSYTPPNNNEPNNNYLIGGPYNGTSNWRTETLSLPLSESGTNRRFIFSWRNDGSVGSEPSAIDNINIKITY